ncbi:TetR/AcrR family transcriptional regulator [Sphaerisporangium sp. TRM90804]|uniref:TetR/AcrR family transcriptional regulator n=1 Tax=Sphaerisporangium sp. TRM90804 TaxID=3031113 RepID=UPI00244899C0|nr:TetR/AcrR family transcriptional regulator [Sphaerisporangium sp. TRM90804]MDH2426168.1 TetR family transcriptional regulator [Sphaerisporangium sp. TRM90804]
MARLTRAQLQERTRARVLAAAKDEFTARGFRATRIDDIADRAELTRGAVYSNFPGKRALYLAVMAQAAEHAPHPPRPEPGRTPRDALGAFARAWVTRLPLATEELHGSARLAADLIPEILTDERLRHPFAQLMNLSGILLGLALENLRPPGAPPARMVRIAEAALTTLHGTAQMSAAAPGFVEPFDIVSVCERLAELDLGDHWPPPTMVPEARPADEPWSPPPATDAVRGEPARLTGDGVVAVLGLHRLAAIEQAVRATPPRAQVTAVLVTADPHELAPLARLVVAEVGGRLRHAFPMSAWPRLQVVCDTTGALAGAAGVPADDETESALRVEAGRVVTRADDRGALHAAATANTPARRRR